MANDLTNETSLAPTLAESNVAGGDVPQLSFDLSLDAVASALHDHGDIVPDVLREAVMQEQPETVEEPAVEVSNEVEELVEAEPQDDIDPETALHVSEKIALSYTDLLDQVGALEIGGKEYTPADLKSILGQDVSAGQKAREASDRLKAIEAKEAQMIQAEGLLKARQESNVNHNKLATIQADYGKLEGELNKAREEGDVYNMQLLKDKQDQLRGAYAGFKAQIDNTAKQHQQQRLTASLEGLRARGLEHLTVKGPQAQAWTDYASAKLTTSQVDEASITPAMAEIIEKARKWDTAQGKEGQKLVSKAKTLKANGRKAPSQAQQNDAVKRKISSGQGTAAEIQAAFNQQGLDMFRPFDG